MPNKTVIDVRMTFLGPLLTRSSTPGAIGVDAPMARNSRGQFELPGSLIKGCLREAWTELHEALGQDFNPDLDDWLGRGSSLDQATAAMEAKESDSEASQDAADADEAPDSEPIEGTVDPHRGLLSFSNFTCDASGVLTRTRVSLDPQRGAARKGHLQTFEVPFSSGRRVTFHGRIAWFADSRTTDEICGKIRIGLRWLTSLGGQRTIGFGRLLDVSLSRQPSLPLVHVSPRDETSQLALVLRPRDPFCVAGRRTSANLFESSEIIPGSVIKGSLARSWQAILGGRGGTINADSDPERRELASRFADIRFGAAFPAPLGRKRRSVVYPLSLVKADQRLYDVALCTGPGRIGKEFGQAEAPKFPIDWKDHGQAGALFGWPDISRQLRVRTAIDADLRRAKDEQLFAYEMIVPDGLEWHCRIDFSSAGGDRTLIAQQLTDLLSGGLSDIGKSKAVADIEVLATGVLGDVQESDSTPWSVEKGRRTWVLTLQTPCLLTAPQQLADPPQHVDTFKSARKVLTSTYEQAFKDIGGGLFRMDRFFSREFLSGGFYLYHRFQRALPSFRPYLLSDAGSVFVLSAAAADGERAQRRIEEWRTQGLPLPEAVAAFYTGGPSADWTNCPYVPSNGYGEVAVNLEIHQERRPHDNQYWPV